MSCPKPYPMSGNEYTEPSPPKSQYNKEVLKMKQEPNTFKRIAAVTAVSLATLVAGCGRYSSDTGVEVNLLNLKFGRQVGIIIAAHAAISLLGIVKLPIII